MKVWVVRALLFLMIFGMSISTFGSPIGLSLTPAEREALEIKYSPPDRDSLQPRYSLDPAEREKLIEHLDKVKKAYEVMQFRARMQFMGMDSAFEVKNHFALFYTLRERRDEMRAIFSIKAPILPEHVYWLMTVSQGAFQEEPKDWRVIETVLWMGLHIERQPWLDRLARDVLTIPLSDQADKSPIDTILSALCYLQDHWASDSARTIAFIFTLPYQPKDRIILPVPEDAPRSIRSEEWLSECASNIMGQFTYYPERTKEILNSIDSIVAEGRFSLSEEMTNRILRCKRRMAYYYPDDPYWMTPDATKKSLP